MRAKFQVNAVNKSPDSVSVEVQLSPVVGTDGENKDFWEATPNGRLEMTITNPNVMEFLKVNKQYYLDFSEVG
ncbi:MAG: hypothetical protein KME40_32000 [Komarekiella atlantica HA4396-MV6]|jgi:hypothetical protein|nr:hypothetical protein [Komarekiella atlantica HA4396-MV6]